MQFKTGTTNGLTLSNDVELLLSNSNHWSDVLEELWAENEGPKLNSDFKLSSMKEHCEATTTNELDRG